MNLTFFQRAWSCPKQGNTDAENEDAWRTVCAQQADTSTLLIAVADGATEGVYSRAWANALVNAVTPEWPQLSEAELSARLQQLRQTYQPLPPGQEMAWNVKTKWMTEGSCATLLASTVTVAGESIELRAVAVGDCCLLVLRADGSAAQAFPVATAADFNTSPVLVRSLFQPQLEYRRLPPMSLQVGDVLLVCTDAVGKWALECVEGNATPQLYASLLELLTESTTPVDVASVTAALPSIERAIPEEASEKPPATHARIIPRWKVPQFVQAWFPKKMSASVPVSLIAEPPVVPCEAVSQTAASNPLAATSFAEWIARAQAPNSTPRMKYDDATMVLCVPLWETDVPPLAQVQTLLRQYQSAASR